MRYKVVPEPRSTSFLEEARAALPLVPGTVEDCCTRIRDRTDCRSRDDAREVLTFLQALGLAGEGEGGFYRTRRAVPDDELATRFRERVFGAREVLVALEAGPLTAAAAFDHVRETVPQWERDRRDDWEAEWRERVERLLGWAVALGLVEPDGETYHLADGAR